MNELYSRQRTGSCPVGTMAVIRLSEADAIRCGNSGARDLTLDL